MENVEVFRIILELMKEVSYVMWHGQIDNAFVIVPIEMQTIEILTCPIDGGFVMILKGI